MAETTTPSNHQTSITTPAQQDAVCEKIVAQTTARVLEIRELTKEKEPQICLDAGRMLMQYAQEQLGQMKNIVPLSHPQYQHVADNLANEILQCAINYYNNSKEVNSERVAIELLEYACSIAVSQMVVERCQQNYNVLHKNLIYVPPVESASLAQAVRDELEQFLKKPKKTSYAIAMMHAVYEPLMKFKKAVGAHHPSYLRLSTQVAAYTLAAVIEELNGASPSKAINNGVDEQSALLKLKVVLAHGWKALMMIEGLDMESEYRQEQFLPNKEAVRNTCASVGVPTPTEGAEYRMGCTTPTATPPCDTAKKRTAYNWLACIAAIFVCLTIGCVVMNYWVLSVISSLVVFVCGLTALLISRRWLKETNKM